MGCEPNQEKCISTCSNDSECGDDKYCKDNVCVYDCAPNETRCEDGFSYTCQKGKWNSGSACVSGCDENGKCKDNTLEPELECGDGKPCADGKECNAEGKCVDKTVETECSTDKPCPDNKECNAEGKCVDKNAGCKSDNECESNQVCRDGKCVEKCVNHEDCSDADFCYNKKCYSVGDNCNNYVGEKIDVSSLNGYVECKSLSTNIWVLEKCNDDMRLDGLECKPKILCSKDDDCVDEYEGYACDAGQCKQKCENNGEPCDNIEGATCYNNVCIKSGDTCQHNDSEHSVCQNDNKTLIQCEGNHWNVIKCSDDEICLGGYRHAIGECSTDEACYGNEKCDARQCKPKCSSNSECTEGICKNEVCIKDGDKCGKSSDFCEGDNVSYQCIKSDDENENVNNVWSKKKCVQGQKCEDGMCKDTCENCSSGVCDDDGVCVLNGGSCDVTKDKSISNDSLSLICIDNQWYEILDDSSCSNAINGTTCGENRGVCFSESCVSKDVTGGETRCFGEDLIGVRSHSNPSSPHYDIYRCSNQEIGDDVVDKTGTIKKCQYDNGKASCMDKCENNNDDYDKVYDKISEYGAIACDENKLTYYYTIGTYQYKTNCIDNNNMDLYTPGTGGFGAAVPASCDGICDRGICYNKQSNHFENSCVVCENVLNNSGYDGDSEHWCEVDEISKTAIIVKYDSDNYMLVHCLSNQYCQDGNCVPNDSK